MSLKSQRAVSARILKSGKNRVWIDPERRDEIGAAITRKELARLIGDGAIQKRPEIGVSRGRVKVLHAKRRAGKRRGHGSREGTHRARTSGKRQWVTKIRALRKRLKALKEKKSITNTVYSKLYRMAKGGAFKDTAHLLQYLETSGQYRRKSG